MKQLITFVLMMCLTLTATAQNTWEEPALSATGEKINPDQKYLVGAVPLENGKVTFSTTLKAPGKSAAEIYGILLKELTAQTKEEGQSEQSRITLSDKDKGMICGSYQEWLVFKRTALVLDRTRFMYYLIVNCRDGEADVKLTRIYYLYEEERDPQTLPGEDVITDEYGLKKNKQKLSRVYGKFRRKTIDRKDYLFNKFAKLLE